MTAVRRFAPLALRMALSLGILAWLGTRVDWAHVAAAFRGLRWGYWAAAVGLYVVCQLLCSVRWMWLSRPLGFQQSLARFTGIYFVGMFFNLFLPTSVGGDAVRAIFLAKGSGQRMNAILSVLLDRVSGLLVLLTLACAAAVSSPVELPPQLKFAVAAVGGGALVGLCLLPFATKFTAKLHWPGEGAPARAIAKLRLLATSTDAAIKLFRTRPDVLVGTTAISIVVQLLNTVLVGLVGLALGLNVPPVYYGVAVPMVTLLTLAPLTLNGVGLREGGMVLFLAPAGVAAADAVTLAFLWFCVQTTTSLFGAGVYLVGHFSPPEELPDERPTVDRGARQGRAGQCVAAA